MPALSSPKYNLLSASVESDGILDLRKWTVIENRITLNNWTELGRTMLDKADRTLLIREINGARPKRAM
jgi:hypothetical protein